jgi:hypothetical protein
VFRNVVFYFLAEEHAALKNQTAFLIFNFVVVTLSFLTGIRVIPGPELFGIILSFYSLLILPPILFFSLYKYILLPSLRGICVLFFTGLAYLSLLVCLGFIPGMKFTDISAIGTGINIFLLVLVYFRSRNRLNTGRGDNELILRMYGSGPGNKKGKIFLLIVLFALCFTFFFGSGDISIDGDSLDHLSFIRRALDSENILPGDSFYLDGDGKSFDPRKGIWHSAVALLTFQADVTSVYMWKMLPSFLSFFVIVSFLFFAVELLTSFPMAVFAAFMLLLFFRGEGLRWFTKVAYSRHIVQGVLWVAIGLMLRQLRKYERGKGNYILLFLIAFTGAAIHIVFPVLLFVFLAGLFIFVHLPGGKMWKEKYWNLTAIQLAGVAIPLILRLFSTTGEYNFIHIQKQGMFELTKWFSIVDPLEIIASLGSAALFAIFIAPFYFLAVWKRKEFKVVEVLYILPVLVVITPFVSTILQKYMGYLYFRILYAAPLYCFLSFVISDSAGILFTGRSRMNYGDISIKAGVMKRIAALIVLGLFVFFPVRYSAASLFEETGGIIKGEQDKCGRYQHFFKIMNRFVPSHSVILSDPVTSYIISGLTDHFVYVISAQHESPSDLMALERNRRIRDILCTSLPVDGNIDWLEEEKIDYIIVDKKGAGVSDYYGINGCEYIGRSIGKLQESSYFKQILEYNDFILFELSYDTDNDKPGSSPALLYDNNRMVLPKNAIPVDVGSGVVLEAFSINNNIMTAGDTVSSSFWWSLKKNFEFGVPLMWTVRFDTDYPKGALYRPWYSKQYRRRVERSNGIFYRFTLSRPLKGDGSYPDIWKEGEVVKQDFSFILPKEMKADNYRIMVRAWNGSYLPNRNLSDYLLNKDSVQGEFIRDIFIVNNEK